MAEHLSRGNVLFDLGRYDEASQAYLLELADDPQSWDAHLNLGLALLNSDKIQEAREELQEAISIAPNEAVCYCALSSLELACKRIDKAEQAILQALNLSPTADCFVILGSIRLQQLRFNESEKALLTALEIDPNHEDGKVLLAEAIRCTGNFVEAEALLSEARSSNPENPNVHSAIARLKFNSNRSAEAAQAFIDARAINPVDHNDRKRLAMAYGREIWPLSWLEKISFWLKLWQPRNRWAFASIIGTALILIHLYLVQNGEESSKEFVFGLILFSNIAFYLVVAGMINIPAGLLGRFLRRRDLDLSLGELFGKQTKILLLTFLTLHTFVTVFSLGAAVNPQFAFVFCSIAVNHLLLISVYAAKCFTAYFVLMLIILVAAALTLAGASQMAANPLLAFCLWVTLIGNSAFNHRIMIYALRN